MLAALFAEEDAISGRMEPRQTVGACSSSRAPLPPPPRNAAGICGIANQGATCYLNSLLQTLFFTTEFREKLFQLGKDQLGSLENANAQTRIIPLQLQRLFARLLLLNVESASTVELTDSFGWSNNEELQQHDVQELNRILFQAIESSLVGTVGQNLVKDLYNGRIVNQISCLECGRVSEREEDFLDMNVTVSGNESLAQAFQRMFVDVEMMDGNNRYECASCRRLTDATKGMKIRSLPSVFTVSLLRFSYDLVNFQRFKETGHFHFPTDLDLAPYCDSPSTHEESNYELFSVIVHKGSCYGGHYYCYIRDKEAIGKWTPPEDEKIALPTVSTGKVDYLAFDDPTDIVSALLVQTPSNSMTLDNLCAEITRVTGVSWNKRFKRQFGSITKFLRCNQNIFYFNDSTKTVTLLHINQQRFANGHLGWDNPLEVAVGISSQNTEKPEEQLEKGKNVDDVSTSGNHSSSSLQIDAAPLPAGGSSSLNDAAPSNARWFHLDDARVKSVREEDLNNQFSGKESAYMLFYRRKSTYPSETVLYDLPPWLLDEVTEENQRLVGQRTEYEDEINRVSVNLLFATDFEFHNGAITPAPVSSLTTPTTLASGADDLTYGGVPSDSSIPAASYDNSAASAPTVISNSLVLDRRKSIGEMIFAIRDAGGGKVDGKVAVNLVRQFPAGIQLLNTLWSADAAGASSDSSSAISSLPGLVDGAVLFVWNGRDVKGVVVPEDAFIEPVLLEIKTQRLDTLGSPYQESVRHSFPKSMLLSELRHQLPYILNESVSRRGGETPSAPAMECLPADASIARVRAKGRDEKATGGGDARHVAFDTFLLDRQHDDKTLFELGLIDFDTIMVDLTGFSNDDFRAPATSPEGCWAALVEGKMTSQDGLPAGTPCPVTTDLNLPSGTTVPDSVTPSSEADVPQPAPAASFPICIQAQIKAAAWVGGDVATTVKVSVQTTITVGKLKYVIIEAAKADVSRDEAPAHNAKPANDGAPLNVCANDTATTTSTTSVKPPQLNGKFLRLRILEENFGLRTPLMEKMSLDDAGLKDGAVVVLEDGAAPKPGQITISFAPASLVVEEAEIVVEKDCVISECISRMVALLTLGDTTSEGWHLRKTNWEGEAVEAVEDNSATLDQEGIKDGDHVLLEEGVVPPKGFLRLPVWLLKDANGTEETGKAAVDSTEDLDVKSSSSSLKLLQRKMFVAHLELTQDATLQSLKESCARLLAEKSDDNPASIWPSMEGKKPQQIRIATIDAKGIQGSVLKGLKATLKVLHVTNNVELLVSVLEKPEDPSPSQVILRTYLRLPESRSYESLGEILWETAGAGATAASLRTAIAHAHNYPSTEVVLAKYFPEKYEWMVLTDSKIATKQASIKKQYGKQQSKKGSVKKNLRQSPYHIQDGDLIGVKTLSSDPLHVDNFMTDYDEEGKAKQKGAEEDKRRKRQENRQRNNSESQNVIGGGGSGGSSAGGSVSKQAEKRARPEVALTIHVPKYE